jgi:hypothetical protein
MTMDTKSHAVGNRLLHRMRTEFDEMPGLCLTEAQAARLWNLDPPTARLALRMLIESGFLACNEHGKFVNAKQASSNASAGVGAAG